MDWIELLRFVHLVAAATWTGGLIVLSALVVALRRAGADREVLLAAARQFGRVSWTAMAVAVLTVLLEVQLLYWPWRDARLQVKVGSVTIAVAIAAYHQMTAKEASPRERGIVQALILIVSLGIFWAAVRL